MKRIIVALAAAVTLAVVSAAPAMARTGPFKICTQNGLPWCVGSADRNAGTTVKAVKLADAREMTWSQIDTDSHGNVEGYWKFSNGNYMAANDACTSVVIKSDKTSNGTVWTEIFSNGNLDYGSRYCWAKRGAQYGTVRLGVAGSLGAIWYEPFFPPPAGVYEAIGLH